MTGLSQRIIEMLVPELRQMVPRARIVFQQELWEGFQIFHARIGCGAGETVQRKTGYQSQPRDNPVLHTN